MLRITENVWVFAGLSAIVLNGLNDDRPFSLHSASGVLESAIAPSAGDYH